MMTSVLHRRGPGGKKWWWVGVPGGAGGNREGYRKDAPIHIPREVRRLLRC